MPVDRLTPRKAQHMQPIRSITALLGALALTISACNGASDDAAPSESDASGDAQASESASGDGFAIATATTEYGEIIVDADGMTLYVFDPDAQGPSTCEDACAQAWPPAVTDSGAAATSGDADAGLVGTATRSDGSIQVTYDGWPLYYWANDNSPGDITGFGVQDIWWVVTRDGDVVRGGDNPTGDEEESDGSRDANSDYSY